MKTRSKRTKTLTNIFLILIAAISLLLLTPVTARAAAASTATKAKKAKKAYAALLNSYRAEYSNPKFALIYLEKDRGWFLSMQMLRKKSNIIQHTY